MPFNATDIFVFRSASDDFASLRPGDALQAVMDASRTSRAVRDPVVERVYDAEIETAHLPLGDFVYAWGHFPVLSLHAWLVLKATLEPASVVPVRIRLADAVWFGLHVPIADGLLNEAESDIVRSSDGSPVWVKRYVFHPRTSCGAIFRVPATRGREVYVNGEVANLIERHQLTGARLTQVG